MREGTSHDTNDYRHSRHGPASETSTEYEERKKNHVRDHRGVHETFEEYEKCHNRQGNGGEMRNCTKDFYIGRKVIPCQERSFFKRLLYLSPFSTSD